MEFVCVWGLKVFMRWVCLYEMTLCTTPAKQIALKFLRIIQKPMSHLWIYVHIFGSQAQARSFKHSFRCNIFSDFSQHICPNVNFPPGNKQEMRQQQAQDAEGCLSNGFNRITENDERYENSRFYDENSMCYLLDLVAAVISKPLSQ